MLISERETFSCAAFSVFNKFEQVLLWLVPFSVYTVSSKTAHTVLFEVWSISEVCHNYVGLEVTVCLLSFSQVLSFSQIQGVLSWMQKIAINLKKCSSVLYMLFSHRRFHVKKRKA